MAGEVRQQLLDLVGSVFECLDIHDGAGYANHPMYIGYDGEEPYLIQIDTNLKRIEYEPAVTSDHLMMSQLRDLRLRLEARLERSDYVDYRVFYSPNSEGWRLDWTNENLKIFDSCLHEHAEAHHLEKDCIYSLRNQKFVLHQLQPNSYELIRLAGLFLASDNEANYGLTLYQDYIDPPEEYHPILGRLGKRRPFPYFNIDLIDLLESIYAIDTVIAIRILEDLRLQNPTDYLSRLVGDLYYDPEPLRLIDELRPRIAPVAPFDRLAKTLCTRLNFTLAA